jgi:hypothetical protein
MAAVQQNGYALQYVDKSLKSNLRSNYEIVMAAVQQNGEALKYADQSLKSNLRSNYEIVMAAVKQDGLALKHADDSFKNDEYLLSMLLRDGIQWNLITEYASARILQDYDEDTLRNVSVYIKGCCT